MNNWKTEFPLCKIFAIALIIRILVPKVSQIHLQFLVVQSSLLDRPTKAHFSGLKVHVVVSYLEENGYKVHQGNIVSTLVSLGTGLIADCKAYISDEDLAIMRPTAIRNKPPVSVSLLELPVKYGYHVRTA